MFDRQILIVIIFFYIIFTVLIYITIRTLYVPEKILSEIIAKFRALCQHHVVVEKISNFRNTI